MWVLHPSEVTDTVEAKAPAGEAVHVAFADDGRPRLEQPRHHGRVEVGNEVAHQIRAVGQGNRGHGNVVLEAHCLARERTIFGAIDVALPDPGVVRIVIG